MFIISTTCGWNMGDDAIRRGVEHLLGIGTDTSKIWFNRAQMHASGMNVAVADRLVNRPVGEICKYADAFILAGTHEWVTFMKEIYWGCVKHGVPIWPIGLGGPQRPSEGLKAARDHNLFRVATTRDALGEELLNELGIPCKRFLDPSFYFFCEFFDRGYPTREPGIVFNPRLRCIEHIEVYKQIYAQWKGDIRLVVVHEPCEYLIARDLFSTPVFYSGDYRDYLDIYHGTDVYIGGRLHGAIAAISQGAEVHLIIHDPKHAAADSWPREYRFPELEHTYGVKDVNDITLHGAHDYHGVQKAVQRDFLLHQTFCQQHVCWYKHEKEEVDENAT